MFSDYLMVANEELDADKSKLRKYIEPGKQVRKKIADWSANLLVTKARELPTEANTSLPARLGQRLRA